MAVHLLGTWVWQGRVRLIIPGWFAWAPSGHGKLSPKIVVVGRREMEAWKRLASKQAHFKSCEHDWKEKLERKSMLESRGRLWARSVCRRETRTNVWRMVTCSCGFSGQRCMADWRHAACQWTSSTALSDSKHRKHRQRRASRDFCRMDHTARGWAGFCRITRDKCTSFEIKSG